MKTGYKFLITGAILIAIFAFVFILYKSTTREVNIEVYDNAIDIQGAFGTQVNFNQITSIELRDTIPAIEKKKNGSGIGDIRKGEFILKDLGDCRLYIHTGEGPYIYILASGNYIIINLKDAERTEALYQDIKTRYDAFQSEEENS